MTDAELRDAAVAELKLTTVGWSKVKSYSPEKLGTTHWGKALNLLGQIGGVAPPPTPPSGVAYPASYYTGPLGQKNILPPKKGAFLISALSMPGEATTWEQWKTRVVQRETAMGRKYDGLMSGYGPGEAWQQDRLRWIHDRGCIPIAFGVNWVETGKYSSVADINNGALDSDIDMYADHFASLGFPLIIRLFHEFDLPHLAYTCLFGREAGFVSAWRRVVDRFKARGATNVGFWWCPTEGTNRPETDRAYPGDAYVDWVGTDTYNWVYVEEGEFATPLHGGWAEFWECFNYYPGTNQNRHDMYGPRKPFVIGETGCVYDSKYPRKKGEWFRNIPAAARNMQHLCGIGFFDVDAAPSEGPRMHWIVDHATTVPEIMQGFVAMARDPHFNTRA